MRNLFLSLLAVLCLATTACKPDVQNLTSCQWKFVEVKNKKTSEITKIPQSFKFSEKPYLIEFKGNNKINFPTHCNIHSAKYAVKRKNVIKFDYFSPMTEMYCVGLHECEMLIFNNFKKSLTYSITKNSLVIDCEDNTLYFEKFEE